MINILRLPPPDWWFPGIPAAAEQWWGEQDEIRRGVWERSDPRETQGFRPAKETPDRAFLSDDGQIWILAGQDEWFGRRHPKPVVIGDEHTRYEWAMMLTGRHPYRGTYGIGDGRGAERKKNGELREKAIDFGRLETANGLVSNTRKIFEALAACKPVTGSEEDLPKGDVLRRDDVLAVLDELGADEPVIRELRAAREHQAADQRPTPELQEIRSAAAEPPDLPTKREQATRPAADSAGADVVARRLDYLTDLGTFLVRQDPRYWDLIKDSQIANDYMSDVAKRRQAGEAVPRLVGKRYIEKQVSAIRARRSHEAPDPHPLKRGQQPTTTHNSNLRTRNNV